MTLTTFRARCSAWFANHTARLASAVDLQSIDVAVLRRRIFIAQCVGTLAIAVYAGPADAYMGEQMLNMISARVLAPIALFVIIGGVIAYMVAPQHGRTILGTCIGIIVLFAVIKGGSTIVAWMNDTTLDH
jgi:hypothetical protein